MTHRFLRTFRRAFLPALLLMLPAAAFPFAASRAPADFQVKAPVRVSDPQRIADDNDPASVTRPGTTSPSAPSGPTEYPAAISPCWQRTTASPLEPLRTVGRETR